jgi:hypothetical protein
MRRLLTVMLASVALALVGPACGGSDEDPAATLAAASSKTIDAKSSKLALVMEMRPQSGSPTKITAEGAFNYGSRQGTMTMDAGSMGMPGLSGNIEMILLGEQIYMKFPAGLLPGKPWLKIDLNTLGEQSGIDLAGLQQLGSNDPSNFLRYLEGAGDDAKKVGEEKVRGVDTTHYRATFDLEQVKADASADLKDDIDEMIKQLGDSKVPADVWIDGDGLARRMKFVFESIGEEKLGMTITQELFDFGVKVEATAPPADQVSDFAELLQQAGQSG